ncbi:MAG: hypothetical protein K8S24_01110 [Candidatus Aegiribacteria sp.]|nr:hypothetical protein [Candidatus Aegiribacteria sp.]
MNSKVYVTATAVLITVMSISSCGGSEENASVTEESNLTGAVHLKLITDYSIGVELGDTNYVFGQIVEAYLNENGDVLVLDMSTMNVRKFSSVGEFVGSAGRQGTGPGEFQMPRGMAVLGNNDFIVSDMAGGAICVFDDSMNWKENITGFFPRPPFTVRSAGDSAFVGILPAFDREEGLSGYSIVRMENSSEPVTVYDEEMHTFDPSRIGPLGAENNPIFTSDNAGHAFIAEPGTDLISITGYRQDGEPFLSIDESVERIEKTPEELAQEQAEFEEFSARRGSHRGRMSGMEISFDPIPFRRAVTDLGVDSKERLWVRLGTYRYPFWNIYDFEGELLFTASLEIDDPDIDYMVVRITENGAVAWIPDPITWPRVQVLEIPDAL